MTIECRTKGPEGRVSEVRVLPPGAQETLSKGPAGTVKIQVRFPNAIVVETTPYEGNPTIQILLNNMVNDANIQSDPSPRGDVATIHWVPDDEKTN